MRNTTISMAALIALLWARRLLIVAITGAFVVAGIIYATTRKPLYESSALLAPARSESLSSGLGAITGQFAALGGLLGVNTGRGVEIDEAVAILASQQFTDRFIKDHAVRQQLFPGAWDAQKQQWASDGQGHGSLAVKVSGLFNARSSSGQSGPSSGDGGPSMEDSRHRFEQLRTVVVDRRTGFVRLAVRAPTASLAQQWANALIADINSTLRAQSLAEAQRAVEVLGNRMSAEQIDSVRNTAATLLESQLQREVFAQIRADFALRVLDPPTLPERRSYPRRTRMVILSALCGGLFACCFVLAQPTLLTLLPPRRQRPSRINEAAERLCSSATPKDQQ